MIFKIQDTSLARLINLLNNKTCAIITAYRETDPNGNKLSKQENIQRNQYLRVHLTENRIAVYSLVGHWQETLYDTSYEVER